MSILNSKFDIVSVDNPVALAALAQVLTVPGGMTLNSEGTPVAGVIPAGAIVRMDTTTGEAVLATTADVVASRLNAVMTFVTIDGNKDFSGSFVQKLTVLNGGFTMLTDQYDAGAYTPGKLVSFNAGKIKLAAATDQIIGAVGPAGLDAVLGVLQVIVPQGGLT
jgi:uncharacterized protein GlcG (DUF336 family)